MEQALTVFFIFLMFLGNQIVSAQNYDDQYYADSDSPYPQYNTGLPGDNFSLEGALELFRQSSSPESFEKALNDERNYVNNLDLNQDGYIDYVRVRDLTHRNDHAVVIQAILGPGEVQDIAVIEIERKDRDEVLLQIVGDEDIYGENVIVEPKSPDYTDSWYANNSRYSYQGDYFRRRNAYYNSWNWPIVQYIYAPTYVAYSSPWIWHSRPIWYRPWRPYAWNSFYRGCRHYHQHFVIINRPVIINVRNFYEPHRAQTVIVRNNFGTKINTYRTEREKYVVNTGKFRIYEPPKSNTPRTSVDRQGNQPSGAERATVTRTDPRSVSGNRPDTRQSATRQTSTTPSGVSPDAAPRSNRERMSDTKPAETRSTVSTAKSTPVPRSHTSNGADQRYSDTGVSSERTKRPTRQESMRKRQTKSQNSSTERSRRQDHAISNPAGRSGSDNRR